jgi:flavin-dependent thymidylate synthase
MNVKLVSITQSLIDEKQLSAEDLIVYIARVSNPNNQLNTETSDKLLNYLIKNKHWSPFEHVSFTAQIKTSRAIAAQILRHRSFVFQEFSQRYSKITNIEPIQLRKQADANRQSSTDVITDKKMHEHVNKFLDEAKNLYDDLIMSNHSISLVNRSLIVQVIIITAIIMMIGLMISQRDQHEPVATITTEPIQHLPQES